MRSALFLTGITLFIYFDSCNEQQQDDNVDEVIAKGQMPNIVKDNSNSIHLVYRSGDSLLYAYSSDTGKKFSSPSLISVLPKLVASHTRGPQIAVTSEGLIVTACNELGDIFSFTRDQSGKWSQPARVNDADTMAKEGFMALAADGQNAFAAWLDIRGNRHNKIFGAKSNDGGKTWSKNRLIYASPDNTVCECCKPSVVMKGNQVDVMFRNWLNGNRDLYLTQSSDGGNTFGEAQKLGNGSWPLNGCPMDGGGLSINKNGYVQTVWRRQNKIYACEPNKREKEIGEGRSCTMESVNGENVYAWTERGEIIILKSEGPKKKLGRGSVPVIKSINDQYVICVWENEKQIHSAIVKLKR